MNSSQRCITPLYHPVLTVRFSTLPDAKGLQVPNATAEELAIPRYDRRQSTVRHVPGNRRLHSWLLSDWMNSASVCVDGSWPRTHRMTTLLFAAFASAQQLQRHQRCQLDLRLFVSTHTSLILWILVHSSPASLSWWYQKPSITSWASVQSISLAGCLSSSLRPTSTPLRHQAN